MEKGEEETKEERRERRGRGEVEAKGRHDRCKRCK
jgi:hypothetical protein